MNSPLCPRLPQRRSHASGSALIITLAVLVLMSIMVVSLSDLMRVERGSAGSHFEKGRADMMAEMGTAKVVATLRKETADTTRNWISQPGQIVASAPSSSSLQLIDPPIPLSSGKPDAVTSTFPTAFLRPAELNVPTFDSTLVSGETIPPHVISNQPDPDHPDKAVSMAVRWVYVRKDGTEDLSEQPDLSNKLNPVVGRYGYWTDDESCKVNYNLAWTRNTANPNQPSHPTKINLPTLFAPYDSASEAEAKAQAIHFYRPADSQLAMTPSTIVDYRAFSRFFYHTPEDARQVARLRTGVDTALLRAKFNVTHYNHDPDTTFFNEPRIVLTTQPDKAGWTKVGSTWVGTNGKPWINGQYDVTKTGTPLFLNIAATDPSTGNPYTDTWDPLVRVDPTKLADVINRLNRYLQRSDWPIVGSTASFQNKYYSSYAAPANTERLTQISLNIVNYVRTKESAGDPANAAVSGRGTGAVIPIRGEKLPGANFVLMEIATTPNSYIGITRTPKMTEMALWVDKTPSATDTTVTPNKISYPGKAKVEIYLPPNFGLPKFDLTKMSWFVAWSPVNGSNMVAASPEANIVTGEIAIYDASGALRTGATVMNAGDRAVITRNVTVQFTGPRPTGTSDVGLRYAISIVRRLDVCPLGDPAISTLDPITVTDPNNVSSIEVDDPRVNSYKGDWIKVANGPGGKNNTFGAINKISSVGLSPANVSPKQDLDNAGKITDISLVMPAAPGTTGNTLSANPTGVVGSSGELGFIHTGMESTAKAGIPWRTLHLQPDPTQALPDWAFMDLFTVPADIPPDKVGFPSARAIYSPHGTATGGRVNMNAKPEPFDINRQDPLVAVFENATYNATNLTQRLSHDQAVTIAQAVYNRQPLAGKTYGYANGYDSPGEVVEVKGVADTGEASEQLVREVANLITARGGVFSVYTVGQAVKQTPNSALIVTGELRQQAMIERYSDKTGIHFHPVFFRSLTP